MKIVILGLEGARDGAGHNDSALRWRALILALARRGHRVVAVERGTALVAPPVPPPGVEWLRYEQWGEVAATAARHADEAGLVLALAQGPDGVAAAVLARESRAERRALYDPDAAESLTALVRGGVPGHLPGDGQGGVDLAGFDLVLASGGGPALDLYRQRARAAAVAPLYPWIVPDLHHPADARTAYLADLACVAPPLGAAQAGMERFFLSVARRLPRRRFLLSGGDPPDTLDVPPNLRTLPALDHTERGAMLASATLTLALARDDERAIGWFPSDRLFEAAACGVPIVADRWEGLDAFFEPGREILVANDTDDVTTGLMLPRGHLAELGRRARQRVLSEHSAERRVQELRSLLDLTGGGDD